MTDLTVRPWHIDLSDRIDFNNNQPMNDYIVRADATVKNVIIICTWIRALSSCALGYWRLTMLYFNLILKQKPIVCMLCMTSVLLLLMTSAWIRQESASALQFPAMSSLARERLRHVITSEQFQRVLQHNFSSNTLNDVTDVIRQLSDHGDSRYPPQTTMYIRDTPQSTEVKKSKFRSFVKNAEKIKI